MAEEINDEFYSVPESEEENTLDSDEVLQAAKKTFGISYFFSVAENCNCKYFGFGKSRK